MWFWGILIVIRAGLRDLAGRRLISLSWMHRSHGLSLPTYPPLGLVPRVRVMCLITFYCAYPSPIPSPIYTLSLPFPLTIFVSPSVCHHVTVNRNLNYGNPSGATIFLRRFPRPCVNLSMHVLLSTSHPTRMIKHLLKFSTIFRQAYYMHRKLFLPPPPRRRWLHAKYGRRATTRFEQFSSQNPTLVV